jgi:hypothetical protein
VKGRDNGKLKRLSQHSLGVNEEKWTGCTIDAKDSNRVLTKNKSEVTPLNKVDIFLTLFLYD